MIFDLFEAAQEFLSEITPTHVSASTASCLGSSSTTDVDVKVSLVVILTLESLTYIPPLICTVNYMMILVGIDKVQI